MHSKGNVQTKAYSLSLCMTFDLPEKEGSPGSKFIRRIICAKEGEPGNKAKKSTVLDDFSHVLIMLLPVFPQRAVQGLHTIIPTTQSPNTIPLHLHSEKEPSLLKNYYDSIKYTIQCSPVHAYIYSRLTNNTMCGVLINIQHEECVQYMCMCMCKVWDSFKGWRLVGLTCPSH